MNLTDQRLQAALDAATSQIQTTAAAVADRVCELLSSMAESSTRIIERDLMLSARLDLVRNIATFHGVFRDLLQDRIAEELGARGTARRPLAATDFESLSLVDDHEVEERMAAERIAEQITHECEAELRDLNAHMRGLLRAAHADEARNPLRPEIVGHALHGAIEAVTEPADMRKLLARDMGRVMARAMPVCYAEIVRDLKARGIQAQHMPARAADGPGHHLHSATTGYSTAGREWHSTGHSHGDPNGLSDASRGAEIGLGGGAPGAPSSVRGMYGATARDGLSAAGSGYGGSAFGGAMAGSGVPGSGEGRPGGSGMDRGAGHGGESRRMSLSEQADAQLMSLLRRLTTLANRPGGLDPLMTPTAIGGLGGFGGADTTIDAGAPTAPMGDAGPAAVLPSLMAVNLIRAHREELRQASGGRLDHMVIDVVGSLFDQILSDARVAPQMARQIARLQLPVLRVALNDSSFFSSRRHPVRRFVNRMASLACAFDEFEEGPGLEFINRVRELVQEIIDSDFDQIEIYAAKLTDLESFIAVQSQSIVQETGAAATFEKKESELRLQQRYMLQLQTALAPLSLPAYLREFLAQVWSQALVLASSRDGPDSDRSNRYRRVGRELVMSIQPKGSPALRKKFLMQLPSMMKDLYEGMKLIGWPEAAQKEFFGKLLPAHAESLRQPPLSELDHNMLVKQLDAVFHQPVPRGESISSAEPIPPQPEGLVEQRFTADEARSVGLVEENTVDWNGQVDIDLSAEAGDTPAPGDTPVAQLGVDANLDMAPADNAEPASGARLMDHIQLGFAYQMHLKDKWQKVRLTYVSPGRSFFVFSRGKKYQETISMTSRMLSRMCETGRLRAFESAYLMERATQRARRQLAAMKTPITRQ